MSPALDGRSLGHCNRHTKQLMPASVRGFTLIEALVTFVILAVGVLGVVSLLTTAKTSEYEAVQRNRAVSLADSMLEKIRRNPTALANYQVGVASPLGEGAATAEPAPSCYTATCTPQQLAVHDLWAWEQMLRGTAVTAVQDGVTINTAALRDVRACIIFTNWGTWTNSGELSVLVQWQGLQDSVDGVGPGDVACGGATADTDVRRRSVVVNTFVADEAEI